jgi:hypothetical protein
LKRSVDQEKAKECHATGLGSRCTAGADNKHCNRYEQVRNFPTGHFDQPRGCDACETELGRPSIREETSKQTRMAPL